MKTMMMAAAGLLLVAGQTMAATSEITAATTPIAHAQAGNICIAPQKTNARVNQVRGRLTNRCDLATFGGAPLVFGLTTAVIVGAIIYGEVKNHQASP